MNQQTVKKSFELWTLYSSFLLENGQEEDLRAIQISCDDLLTHWHTSDIDTDEWKWILQQMELYLLLQKEKGLMCNRKKLMEFLEQRVFEPTFPEQQLQKAIEILIACYDTNVNKMVHSNVSKLFHYSIWPSLSSSSPNNSFNHKIVDTNGLFISLKIVHCLFDYVIGQEEDVEKLLYHYFDSDEDDNFLMMDIDSEQMGHFRLAELVNAGLESEDPRNQIESLQILRLVAFEVSTAKAMHIMEILINFEVEVDEVSGAMETFIWSSIWEILFVRDEIAMILLPDQVEDISRDIWKSFHHPELSIRLVVLFSAARILMFQTQKTSYSVPLLLQLLNIYTSSESKDIEILELLCRFFEEHYGKEDIHQLVLKSTILYLNQHAYCEGIPLPSYHPNTSRRSSQGFNSSQLSQYQSTTERLLRLHNKFLVAKLEPSVKQELLQELQSLFEKEFSMQYTLTRLEQVLNGQV